MLPFSRMRQFSSIIRATAPTRIASLRKDHFEEMFRRIADIQPRLVGLPTDRVRETARAGQQREKLAALGKLSAVLAHLDQSDRQRDRCDGRTGQGGPRSNYHSYLRISLPVRISAARSSAWER
jgi:CRP-like cAMP-binding protein